MTLYPRHPGAPPAYAIGASPKRQRHPVARRSPTRMPHFLLTFGDASRPPVAAVIIEAPSMFEARMTAGVRSLAPGVPFGEALKLTAKMMAAIRRSGLAG